MNESKFPKIGMRTVKTAISVLVCMVLFKIMFLFAQSIPNDNTTTNIILRFLLDRENPIFACVAAIIVMQTTVESSLKLGTSRIWGTAIGAYFGLALLWVDSNVLDRKLNILFTILGVVAVIYFCNIIRQSRAVPIALVTFMIIMITIDQAEPYIYAANRIIDTAMGIGISLSVNYLIRKPKSKAEKNAEKEKLEMSIDEGGILEPENATHERKNKDAEPENKEKKSENKGKPDVDVNEDKKPTQGSEETVNENKKD